MPGILLLLVVTLISCLVLPVCVSILHVLACGCRSVSICHFVNRTWDLYLCLHLSFFYHFRYVSVLCVPLAICMSLRTTVGLRLSASATSVCLPISISFVCLPPCVRSIVFVSLHTRDCRCLLMSVSLTNTCARTLTHITGSDVTNNIFFYEIVCGSLPWNEIRREPV